MEKAGTHEARARLLSNAVYCEGETVTVGDGVTLFFAPWTPSRIFMYITNAFQRGKKQLANLLVPCPENVDVLVTHCPPLGILDVHRKGHHMGSSEILDCVQRVLPSVHLFGHCHGDGGVATGEIDTRHSAAARWRYAMQKKGKHHVYHRMLKPKAQEMAKLTPAQAMKFQLSNWRLIHHQFGSANIAHMPTTHQCF